ncbi:hypothetical protein [Kitasatospora sp. GAS1066B]|uniref:hypothetical protein n=1 Tax=Kitasatospora sp. GAS1066B TaxID=3156271 RepID=UPI0035135E68
MRHYRWILEVQDDEGLWSPRTGAPMSNPLDYDGPPQQAANHLRDVFVRTLSEPAPGPRAVRVRVREEGDPADGAQAESEWSQG